MKTAFLGTGLLGFPMAQKLLEAGHALMAFNRTQSKAEPLKKYGAVICESPKDAIKEVESIILVLSDAKAIQEVLFSKGIESMENKTVIQMGTIAAEESIDIQKKVYGIGGEYFECPVLGSRSEAKAGNLMLMVGSTIEKFEKWQGFLKAFGPNPMYIGEVGKAAALKLALNHLIVSHAVGFSLSLGIIQRSEISVDTFMEILKKSALFAPMFEKKLKNWMNADYDHPNFPVKHLLKDVGLIREAAENLDLSIQGVESARNILTQCVEDGFGEKDYSAVFHTINKIKK